MVVYWNIPKENSLLTFKQHQLYINDDVLSEYVDLEEAAVVDILKGAGNLLRNNPKLIGMGAGVVGAAGLSYLYKDDLKDFAKEQWALYKEEIILTLIDILQDIQDEQLLGIVKAVVKTSPLPPVIKKVLNRMLSTKIIAKAFVRPSNTALRDFIETMIEKNDAIKMVLMKYKNDMKKLKHEVSVKKYHRLQIQAMVNFGHITKEQGDMLLKSGQLDKYQIQRSQRKEGKPHFKLKEK